MPGEFGYLPNDKSILERKLKWLKCFDKHNKLEPSGNKAYCINSEIQLWAGGFDSVKNSEEENSDDSNTEDDRMAEISSDDDDDDDEMKTIPQLQLNKIKQFVDDRKNTWKKSGFDKLIDSNASEKEIEKWLLGQQSFGETTESRREQVIKSDEKSNCLTITTTTFKTTTKYMHSMFMNNKCPNNALAKLQSNNANIISSPPSSKSHKSRDMSRRCNSRNVSTSKFSSSNDKENVDMLKKSRDLKTKKSPPALSKNKIKQQTLSKNNNKPKKNIKEKKVNFYRPKKYQSEKSYLLTPYPKQNLKSKCPNPYNNQEKLLENINQIEPNSNTATCNENNRLRPRKYLPIYYDDMTPIKAKKSRKNTKRTKLPTTKVDSANELPKTIDAIEHTVISNDTDQNKKSITSVVKLPQETAATVETNNIPSCSNNEFKRPAKKYVPKSIAQKLPTKEKKNNNTTKSSVLNCVNAPTTKVDSVNEFSKTDDAIKKTVISNDTVQNTKAKTSDGKLIQETTAAIEKINIPSSSKTEFKRPDKNYVVKSKAQKLTTNENRINNTTKSSFLNCIDESSIQFQPKVNSTAKSNDSSSVYSVCPDMTSKLFNDLSEKVSKIKNKNRFVKAYEESDTNIDFLDFIQQF